MPNKKKFVTHDGKESLVGTAEIKNRFRRGLEIHQKAGRHVCVCLAKGGDQVPSWIARERGGGLKFDPLTALFYFNRELVKLSAGEASAYRLSLTAYANHDKRGLSVLRDLVEIIRIRCPGRMVLLDTLDDDRSRRSLQKAFEQARLLGVEAVVVSPCGGQKELEDYFAQEMLAGEEGVEIFVSCQGCAKDQKKATCFNSRHQGSAVSGEEWVSYIVGHILRCDGQAGVAMVSAAHPRLYSTRSVAGNSVNLLAPWDTIANDAGGVETVLRSGIDRHNSGLIVEVSPEIILRERTRLRQINQLMGEVRASFAA